ncbi:MAG TPA: acyl-CoA synthetase [Acidimicrobiia bacterium]|jgi:acyl-CoA synthetase (AMP-forming)/AMP-acid ligase II|nr:acyl-CoA synthetase [Acidimicrobiia bacterium]
MAWNIADLIEHVADTVPDRVALIVGDRAETFRELEENANRLAHHLAAHGVGPGDHVGIYAFNSHEFVETILAAYKLRAVPINVNYRYVEAELRYLFDNADLVALVHDEQFRSRIDAVRDSLPLLRHTIAIGTAEYADALASGSPERDFGPRSDDDIYILYTGGTTGMPKGVVWRQEDVLCVLGGLVSFDTGERVQDEWQFAKAAVDEPEGNLGIVIAPLMHGAAQWGTLNGLLNGRPNVLMPKFDPDEVWKAVEKHRITTLGITGDAMGRPLIESLEANDYDASSLVTVASTAAVFSATVKERYLERFPNLIIADAVGSTETGYNGVRVIVKGGEEKPGLPTVRMGPDTVVLDDDMNIVQPGSGVIGRMARGGNVPLRYHKDPEKSAATFVTVDGRRYSVSGDYAVVEADGTMTLLGRGSVCINSGGEKIYPEEVEAALKAHPAVFDAVVVGAPDDRWGERVAAVVEVRPGASVTLEELDAHTRAHVAGYKVPRELHIVDKIERSPSGKPDYPWAKRIATGTS